MFLASLTLKDSGSFYILLFLAQQNKVLKTDVVLKDGFYCDLVNGSLKALSVVYSNSSVTLLQGSNTFPILKRLY